MQKKKNAKSLEVDVLLPLLLQKSSCCFSLIKRLLHFSAKRSKVKKYRVQSARISTQKLFDSFRRCRKLGLFLRIAPYSDWSFLAPVLSKVRALVSLEHLNPFRKVGWASGDIGAFTDPSAPKNGRRADFSEASNLKKNHLIPLRKAGKPHKKTGRNHWWWVIPWRNVH